MTTTYPEATDAIMGMFYEEWTANTTAIVGYVPEVRWQNVEEPGTPDSSKYFARITMQPVDEYQSTFRNGENGQRYTAQGLIFVQLFAPKSESQAAEELRNLAQMVKAIFRGHTDADNIWFRRSRINEVAPNTTDNEKFYQTNVVAEYRYDEIG